VKISSEKTSSTTTECGVTALDSVTQVDLLQGRAKASRIVVVSVVDIAAVWVFVRSGFMVVHMTVNTLYGWVVDVLVMPVVVLMSVFVLERRMAMRVGVTLGGVEVDRDAEQHAGAHHDGQVVTLAHDHREDAARERCNGEERARAPCAEQTLRV
jgi:hypothetical protein